IQTAHTVKKMSHDLGIRNLYVVVNKIRSAEEEKLVRESLKDFKVLGIMPYSESVRESDLKNYSPCDSDSSFRAAIKEIALKLQEFMIKKK
ncbi:MAG TPA: carbon monoxide dehydrogenase, partial [Actinobacteria bacterium]|nr:carbon monoxide dehydrogenase [Actinomycetota bacterium]